MISKLAEFILNHIEDLNLKKIFHNHLIDDNKKIYNKKISTKTFNSYDLFIYYAILGRSYAMNNKYSESCSDFSFFKGGKYFE